MKRRDFLFVAGNAAVAWPLAVRAQQLGDVHRVAVLMGVAELPSWIAATASLFHRLGELGWREGRNLVTQVRWNQPGLMQVRAAELIAGSPDVVVVFTNFALRVLKPIAGKVPIVFVGVGDPVGSGFVASLAQPGGNITGFASHDLSLGGKWLEVLQGDRTPHHPSPSPHAHGNTRTSARVAMGREGSGAIGNRGHGRLGAQYRGY